jgi:hypothetical protein
MLKPACWSQVSAHNCVNRSNQYQVLRPKKILVKKMMGTLGHFAHSKAKCELWFGQEAPLHGAEGTKEAREGVHSFRTESTLYSEYAEYR